MKLKAWEDLPAFMRRKEVKPYYDILKRKRLSLLCKRAFDVVCALVLLVICAVPMLVIAVLIKADSPGPVFFRQERVTTYGRVFKIHKFRTMVENADRTGSGVTVSGDLRITKAGAKLRKRRLDELPQLLDVLHGDMSFVGTRPESVRYVKQYKPAYYATLLLPAGITSEASIRFRDEEKLLDSADDADRVYVEQILPQKMKWNLYSLKHFGLMRDIHTMIKTVTEVLAS